MPLRRDVDSNRPPSFVYFKLQKLEPEKYFKQISKKFLKGSGINEQK